MTLTSILSRQGEEDAKRQVRVEISNKINESQ